MSPTKIWVYLLVLPILQGLIVFSTMKQRWVLYSSEYQDFRKCVEDAEIEKPVYVDSMMRHMQRTKSFCFWMVPSIQAILFLWDRFVFNKTLPWCAFYQLLWLSMSNSLFLVRPMVMYSVFLSRTLIDVYIDTVLKRAERSEQRPSWGELMGKHRDLELQISKMWTKLNLSVFIPPLPFFVMAGVHFICDDDADYVESWSIATFLAMFGGALLISMLAPIAGISSLFNNKAAYRALNLKKIPDDNEAAYRPLPQIQEDEAANEAEDDIMDVYKLRRRGKNSVAAVIRSLANEARFNKHTRSEVEQAEYNCLLEYVQNTRIAVYLGWRGVLMMGVTRQYVLSLFTGFFAKLPLVLGIVLQIRSSVQNANADESQQLFVR